jgi:hypothetical protein
MRPVDDMCSQFIRTRTLRRPLAMFVAVAIGGIGSATVILSLAAPPITEPSSRTMEAQAMEAHATSVEPELSPTIVRAPLEKTSTTNAATAYRNVVGPVRSRHELNIPGKRRAQNHATFRHKYGYYHYRNFARYSSPRFSW